ncbi:MAG: DUF1800 domain-containing protein [Phycisphaeraceae bacterium]|nr:DUF1800 domain-containing protein [Phycisphaeraceae bacterium]
MSQPLSDSLRPLPANRFGFDEARHLLWRAGFGGTPAQIQLLASWGPDKSVDYLLNYETIAFEPDAADAFDSSIMRPPNEEERAMVAKARRGNDEETLARIRARRQERERDDRQQMRRVQNWWFKRMIETPRPLEEKLTLFWHGHFSTSFRTIENSYHMYQQNRLLRRYASGNFGELLRQIIRDPAMLAYLDQDDSRKNKPNENLAREIMELFSLGVGNYTEKDIKEGARALTGYTFVDDSFVFRKNDHDDGVKSVLGRTGRLDGDAFVGAILEQRACAGHISQKLYRYFAADYPTGRTEVDSAAKSVVREMASVMTGSKYAIKPVLRKLFLSEHFYSAPLMNEQIKSPVELVVGAVRSLNTPVRDMDILNDACNLMGQSIFFPPNVAGWSGGRSWVNTSTMFVRQNILCFLLTGKKPQGYDALANAEKYDPSVLLADLASADAGAAADPARVVDYLLRFTLGSPTARSREVLGEFVRANGGRATPEVITGLLLLVTAMPEYQLC